MKASEVIVELQRLIKEHGDLPVYVYDSLDPSDLEESRDVELHTLYYSNQPVISIIS